MSSYDFTVRLLSKAAYNRTIEELKPTKEEHYVSPGQSNAVRKVY